MVNSELLMVNVVCEFPISVSLRASPANGGTSEASF